MFMGSFVGCCGSCIYLDTDDYVGRKDKCRCTKRGFYCYLTEKKCAYYEYDSHKDYYDLEHRWHIVSALLALYPDLRDIPGMKMLQDFRTDILEKDHQYDDALRIYDLVGPCLARIIALSPDRDTLTKQIVENWLLDAIELIGQGKNREGFAVYADMVNTLMNRYRQELAAYYASRNLISCPESISL